MFNYFMWNIFFKKRPLKTNNLFCVFLYCQLTHSIPLDPDSKMPIVPLTIYIGEPGYYLSLCSCGELQNV